jgi:hypothetical protein
LKDIENARFFDLADVINEDPKLILDHMTADCVYFIPADIDKLISKKGRKSLPKYLFCTIKDTNFIVNLS